MNLARTWILPTALAALCACQTTPEFPEKWVDTTASAPTDSVLWELALLALEEQGFPVGAGANPSTMVAVTGWRLSLAPFKGEGYRQRVHLKLAPAPEGKHEIALRVQKETNEDLARPMELRFAKWEPAADDEATAAILVAKIRARIGETLTVGEPVKKLARPQR